MLQNLPAEVQAAAGGTATKAQPEAGVLSVLSDYKTVQWQLKALQ